MRLVILVEREFLLQECWSGIEARAIRIETRSMTGESIFGMSYIAKEAWRLGASCISSAAAMKRSKP